MPTGRGPAVLGGSRMGRRLNYILSLGIGMCMGHAEHIQRQCGSAMRLCFRDACHQICASLLEDSPSIVIGCQDFEMLLWA